MTAPKSEQKQRNELLNQVNSHGFIDHYKGIRVTSDGELFKLKTLPFGMLSIRTPIKSGKPLSFINRINYEKKLSR